MSSDINLINESLNDHEVRLRVLERIAEGIDRRFDKLESKMDSNFHWVIGTILGQIALMITLFGGIILHMAKLI